MLWQGEEFGENYFLPDFGAGRVGLLRALRWDLFYDTLRPRADLSLLRKLLRIRKSPFANSLRGTYFFFNDWDRLSGTRCIAIRAVRRFTVHARCYQYGRC